METITSHKSIHYLDARGTMDQVSNRLSTLDSDLSQAGQLDCEIEGQCAEAILSLASPEKQNFKLREFFGQSDGNYQVAGFADVFSAEDSMLLLRNLAPLLQEAGVSIEFFKDTGQFFIPEIGEVHFSSDGRISECGRHEAIGLNAFHYLMCFVDQDFAAVVEKDGKFIYLCDISVFEKTPKNEAGTNHMLGKDLLAFHSRTPNFSSELSRVFPKIISAFRDEDLDMLVVDLNGQGEYKLDGGKTVRRFERDKFLALFDENNQFRGFFGLADVFMQDTETLDSPFEGGSFHPEIESQADLLRHEFHEAALDHSVHPALLLEEIDDEKRVQVLRALLKDKVEAHDQTLALAADLNVERFGNHMELYGISYISDRCMNDCKYCGHNAKIHRVRSSLSDVEMYEDFEAVLRHKPDEFCILAGESSDSKNLLIHALRILGEVNEKSGKPLKRISLNVAPMSKADFQEIVAANESGVHLQFRIFQESYAQDIYEKLHTSGPKSDFQYRRMAQNRALAAGFDSVGVGALLGLNDSHSSANDDEILALVQHALDLKRTYGQAPSSLSIPRHQAVEGYDFETPNPVDDKTYIFYHALLRLALPEVKLIITSREDDRLMQAVEPFVNIRDLAPRPGVGGNIRNAVFQNELGDSRSAEEIIADLIERGKR